MTAPFAIGLLSAVTIATPLVKMLFRRRRTFGAESELVLSMGLTGVLCGRSMVPCIGGLPHLGPVHRYWTVKLEVD